MGSLANRDVIELGNSHCRFRFLLPVADSTTAVLERFEPGGACVHTRDGTQFRRVVLLDDRLKISPKPPAHLVLDELPCEHFTLGWEASGLVIQACDGMVVVDEQVLSNADYPRVLTIPSRLLMDANISPGERLGRIFYGGGMLEPFQLRVHDPFA